MTGAGWVEVTIAGVGGATDHGALLGLADDDHTQYATNVELTAHEGTSHGVTDHGGLGGLADDDHPQYALDTDLTPLNDHLTDPADAHDASAVSILDTAGDFLATDVEGALAELQADAEAHTAAGDPHPGYATDGDLTTHAAAADPHAGYLKESVLSEANVTDLTDGGTTTLHSHAGGGTKELWFPANSLSQVNGAVLNRIGTAPDNTNYLEFTAAADLYGGTSLVMPDNYAGGNVGVTFYFAPNGAVAGSVIRFRLNWSVVEVGDDAREAGTNIDFDFTLSNENFVIMTKSAQQTFTPTGLVAGDFLRLSVGRLGAHVNDDYAAICYLFGVLLEYDA